MYSLKTSLFALTLGSTSACLAACSFDSSNGGNIDGGETEFDAGDGDFDAKVKNDAGSEPVHLLLSEIRNRPSGSEFIEIYNPNSSDISLDDYYLADNGAYLNLPAASIADTPSPPSQGSDFVVRFPPGNSIPSNGVIIVGIAIGPMSPIRPEFQIDPPMDVGGQTMLEAYPGSIRNNPTLTDSGEGVILFHWDGNSNLVSDVDIVIAGNDPTDNNLPPNKTGVLVTGPSGTSRYTDDVASLPNMRDKLKGTESYQRIALEGANETHDGVGNGIAGDDETSEDTTMTWIIADMTSGTVEITK